MVRTIEVNGALRLTASEAEDCHAGGLRLETVGVDDEGRETLDLVASDEEVQRVLREMLEFAQMFQGLIPVKEA